MQKLGDASLGQMRQGSASQEAPLEAVERARRVWSTLTDIYTVSWLDRNGDEPPRTWVWKLQALSEEQIKRGLAICSEKVDASGRGFMPNMPEFIAMCHEGEEALLRALPPPDVTLTDERRIALGYGIGFDETEGKTDLEVRNMVFEKRTGVKIAQ